MTSLVFLEKKFEPFPKKTFFFLSIGKFDDPPPPPYFFEKISKGGLYYSICPDTKTKWWFILLAVRSII